jgi:hypothetical protein
MDLKRKIIIWTVLGTTLFWGVTLLAAFIWLTRQVPGDDVLVDFQREGSVIGMFEVKNPTTNRVFVTIEELPSDSIDTGRVELVRRHLPPNQNIRVGIKKLSDPTE